ncbi:MAG: antitoxin VapB family protein [Methanosarcinales archaeon]|nr:antitoxin VapB family protein [Methanosarcinales archaeon]
MKSQTIKISDHTYNILNRRRHGNEGFDEVIERMEGQLSRKKTRHNIMSFAGMLDNESAECIRNKVEEQRANADREFMKQVEQRST